MNAFLVVHFSPSLLVLVNWKDKPYSFLLCEHPASPSRLWAKSPCPLGQSEQLPGAAIVFRTLRLNLLDFGFIGLCSSRTTFSSAVSVKVTTVQGGLLGMHLPSIKHNSAEVVWHALHTHNARRRSLHPEEWLSAWDRQLCNLYLEQKIKNTQGDWPYLLAYVLSFAWVKVCFLQPSCLTFPNCTRH